MKLPPNTARHIRKDGTIVTLHLLSPAQIAALGGPRTHVPATWAELHRRYLDWPGSDDTAWLRDFTRRITNCGGRRCRENFIRYLQTHPVSWSSAFAYFVGLHNEVNARLDKPLLTVERARVIWAPSDPASGILTRPTGRDAADD